MKDELDYIVRGLDQEDLDSVTKDLGVWDSYEELYEAIEMLSDEDKTKLLESILQKTSPIQPNEEFHLDSDDNIGRVKKVRQYRSNQGRSPERMEASYKVFVWTGSMAIILIIILVITATL